MTSWKSVLPISSANAEMLRTILEKVGDPGADPVQEDHSVPEEQIVQFVSHKIAEVEDEVERLRHVQRELQRLREVAAGLAKGEKQGEF